MDLDRREQGPGWGMTGRDPEPVAFLTLEEDDDLIVSFAIDGDEPGDVISLILLRTPKYESLLPLEERGVSVSHDAFPESGDERLQHIRLGPSVIAIISTKRRYRLDVSRVATAELADARRILSRMNFDDRFILEGL